VPILQLGSTTAVLGRIVGLTEEFRNVVKPAPNCIVDVGANVGSYSILFHNVFPEAKIISVEPSSYNIPYLEYNCKSIPNHEILQLALGDVRKRAEIAMPSEAQRVMNNDYPQSHTGCLSLHGETDYLRETVDVVPLDELDVQRPVGFIKIDTEGYEIQVLIGARKIIREDKPIMLIEGNENNLKMAGTTKWHLFRLIAGMGYFPCFQYGKDFLCFPVGVGYILDRLDYKFMEGSVKEW
jgi:FkbM family methyltransferase